MFSICLALFQSVRGLEDRMTIAGEGGVGFISKENLCPLVLLVVLLVVHKCLNKGIIAGACNRLQTW